LWPVQRRFLAGETRVESRDFFCPSVRVRGKNGDDVGLAARRLRFDRTWWTENEGDIRRGGQAADEEKRREIVVDETNNASFPNHHHLHHPSSSGSHHFLKNHH
jgi:hypothetical protein